MRIALVLSVLLHVLLLSVPIEGEVFGLSGLRFPWEERRLAAADLQVVLAQPPAPAVAAPEPHARPLPKPAPPPAPQPLPPATAPMKTAVVEAPKEDVVAETPPAPKQEPDDAARLQERELIALAREQAAREENLRVEADRIAAERREQARQAQLAAEREEQARRDALARQEEASRLEAERQEAARQELARQEQARQELEQARQEQARQEQARQEQARQEQARQEQARQEQARQERERLALQAAPAAPVPAAPPTSREERLRAIGQQLAREGVGTPPGPPQPTVSGLRRGWLFGRADSNQDLVQYAQAMGRKIELNQTLDMVREALKQPHGEPVVTIAVRADGSVEKVTFEKSSGVPAIDDGIRRIIASQAPFGPFPPALARQYDVVEIRRTWLFDVAVRLQ